MRVTFICPVADLTGGFRVIVGYARRLRQRGHDVLIVSCPRRKPTLREILRAVYRRRPSPIVPRGAPTHLDGSEVPHKMLERIRPPLEGDLPDADVVVATWWETAEWISGLSPEKGVKVHFIQDYERSYEQLKGRGERVDAVCRLPMPKITPARWLEQLLRGTLGHRDVTCIPNAVDLETFVAPPRGKQAIPTVGFTYNCFPPKGCDVMVSAIGLARKARPDLRVISFGAAKPVPELPLPECTEFHLRVTDASLREIYARCDAWLFGTRAEGFGLPILEAMACRTPVIGTPAGAAPELLASGGGILVPMEDPTAMAEAIVKVSAMPEDGWRRMSDAAYVTARRYTWEDATDAFEAALRRILGRPAG